MKSLKIIFSIFLISHFISAEQLYSDLSIQEQQRLEYLSDNIRCPKCSYGNISSSNAPISKDLKNEIAQMIKDGYTDDEIFNLLANRYGDYIILKTTPSNNKLIFILPLMVFLISIFLVTTYTIKKSK